MENKKRLIDANDIEYAFSAICDRESGIPLAVAAWLADAVRKAPTVNAVEVVHGYWKGAGMGDYLCSCCWEVFSGGNRFKYCPNCGAKMDGDGNG